MTAPNRENHVATLLRVFRFDYRIFCVQRRVVIRGIVTDRPEPAFPNYIFVAAEGCWDQINEIIGVIGFIKHGGLDHTVADLDAQVTERGLLPWCEQEHVKSRFIAGDKVRVLNGSACGYHGVFHSQLAHDRALILLDWMGRLVPVSLDDRDLLLDIPPPKTNISRKRRRRHRSRRRRRDAAPLAPALH